MSTSLSDLDLDLDEIDDKEFAIPSLDGPLPTLESILNEEDNDSNDSDLDLNDGLNSIPNEFLDSTENSSISSFDSKGLKSNEKKLSIGVNFTPDPNREIIRSSVIKHSQLKSLSAQLKSANTDRINAGKPTAITVSTNFVAVGTSHGFVLIFDLKQVMKSCLRNTEDLGSVSAISIKKDNSRLMCGYSRGGVTLWNLQSCELIRVFKELHSPQTSVLHLRFMSDNNFGALSDSSGSVFMLDFRRKDIDSQCIFSGSRGEVLAIEPLILPVSAKGEVLNLNSICLLSLATVTKVIALSLRPNITVHFTQILKGQSTTLPLLSWQLVMVQVSEETRVIDPVLAFARQNNIYFFQASYKSSTKVLFTPLMQIRVEYIIQSIVWLNPRIIVTIDETERIHVLDVRSEEELEVIEIDKIEMVYGSSHFKSLENGHNVSPAMSTAADRACYHSICTANATLSNTSSANILILGIESVHMFTIRSWTERIDCLIAENNYEEALDLTLSFYTNEAKAVIGLNGKKSEKRKIVSQKLFDILKKYVDLNLNDLCPDSGRIGHLIQHFKHVIPICIEKCLAIEDNQQLFSDLFDRFSEDSIAKKVFLETSAQYIMSGELKNLSPFMAKELLTNYEEKETIHIFEALVTRLDISCLDIHHVMTVCLKNSLFDAIIYIHNNAFNDFITPFDELIQKIEISVNNRNDLTEEEIGFGEKLFNYIRFSLKGRSFPNDNEIDFQRKSVLIKEILSRITQLTDPNNRLKHIYPNLRILLHFDTKLFLDILSDSFKSFDSENSYLRDQKQKIVDILVQLMVENAEFEDKQIGSLFIFIAKQLSHKRNTISITNELLDQVIDYLFVSQEKEWFEERQNVLLELLQSEAGLSADENRILELAENVNFFRVCEYIYVKNRNWGQNLCSYIRDSERKSKVFDYINQILISPNVSEKEKTVFIEIIYSQIKSLTEIDCNKTSKLLLNHLDIEMFKNIMISLETSPKILCKLLSSLLLGAPNKGHKKDASIGSFVLEALPPNEQRKQTLLTDPKIQEKLIDLLCEFEPNSVHQVLQTLDNYRPDIVLVFCKNHGINDSIAYLLEKTGHFNDAFDLLYKQLEQIIIDFNDSEIEHFMSLIESKMNFLIDFCRRSSAKMVTSEERETLWLPLLKSMLNINHLVTTSIKQNPFQDDITKDLNELMDKLITGMNGTIDLSLVMKTLMNESSNEESSGQQVYDMKTLFESIAENYKYEETLLQTTNNLLLNELHERLALMRKEVNKANSLRNKTCPLCAKLFNFEDNIILFHCSHSFHEKCLESFGKQNRLNCQLCHQSSDESLGNKISNNRLNLASDSVQINEPNVTKQKNCLKFLSESQLISLEYLRRGQRIDSRANILNQLPNTGIRLRVGSNNGPTDEFFKLKLAPQWKRISDERIRD